jgi:hypothetical protein
MFRIGRIAGPQQAAGAHLGVMEGLHIVFFCVLHVSSSLEVCVQVTSLIKALSVS